MRSKLMGFDENKAEQVKSPNTNEKEKAHLCFKAWLWTMINPIGVIS